MAELLAPAGNIEALDAAIGEGADAVYMGLKSFNARLRSSNFAWREFEAAVQSLHRLGKKIYVAVNTVSEERETERLFRFLTYLSRVGPDALIVQDFGVVRMCQEFFPNLELHASTQMNVESAAGANLLSRSGIKRVVVARELGLEEIRAIKAGTNVEIEVFVHGALCVSESGLCLFSSYLGGKSANRGMCTQACRRFYSAETPAGSRAGYFFSPCDLQLIEKIPSLLEAGVESFKIEGRMKSAEYVGAVVAAYRYLLDHYQTDKKGALATAKRFLSTDFARSKTRYWYDFSSEQAGIEGAGEKILNPDQAGGTGIYLGKIEQIESASEAAVAREKESNPESKIVMARFSGGNYEPETGDSIRLHRADDSGRVSHKIRTVEMDENGRQFVDIPTGFKRGDEVYLLQTKAMSKRYPRVLPQDLSHFRKQPGAEILPVLDLTPVSKNELSYFPEGTYIQVSSVSDVFLAQSKNPVRIILELNEDVQKDLLSHKTPLPVSKKSVILSLDPYCTPERESFLANAIPRFVADGFTTFVANNTAHLSILRKNGANAIAGPYLYTFNRWAVSWLENQGVGAFITPLENSFQNIKATFEPSVRARAMITVYSYPALFRMRFRLPENYDFSYFFDKEGSAFRAYSAKDGSFVLPEQPFSIADRVEKVRQEGFCRVLVDFSRTSVTRQELKTVWTSMQKSLPIEGASRFNWKDGFYSVEKIESYRAMNAFAEEARDAQSGRKKGTSRTFRKNGCKSK